MSELEYLRWDFDETLFRYKSSLDWFEFVSVHVKDNALISDIAGELDFLDRKL